MYDYSEKKAAKALGARLTRGSGAVFDDADMRLAEFLIESKRRDNIGKKVIFYAAFWEKLKKQAVRTNRTPMYMWHTDGRCFVVTYLPVMVDVLQKEGRRICTGDIKTTGTTNTIMAIEEFDAFHAWAYNKNMLPLMIFYYGKFEMALIDFETFKNCMEAA